MRLNDPCSKLTLEQKGRAIPYKRMEVLKVIIQYRDQDVFQENFNEIAGLSDLRK